MSNVNPTRAIAMATLTASRVDADAAEQRRAAKHALSRSHLAVAHLEKKLVVELEKAQQNAELAGHAISAGSMAYGATAPKVDPAADVTVDPEPNRLRETISGGFALAPSVQEFHDRGLERDLTDAVDAERAARSSAGRSEEDAQRERGSKRSANKMVDHLWELVRSK